jgi:LPS sulfotransferase NodH
MRPALSYIICATPRSGSYLLCEALRNTGVAGRPTEYLSQTFEAHWAARWRTESYRAYIDKVLEAGTTPNRVFGVKLHIHQFEYCCGKLRGLAGLEGKTNFELMREVFDNPRYLWIRRRDKLAQAISYLKANQSNVWWDSEAPPAPYARPTPERVHFDFHGIERNMARMEREELAWQAYFEANGIEPVATIYEELAEAYEASALRILYRLGITPPAGLSFGQRSLHKQHNSESARWAQRYRRLEQAQAEKTLASFRDLHQGEAIYVCGLGLSLNELRQAERKITIGVNDIGKSLQPNYLLVVDPRDRLKPERYEHIDNSRADFVFTDRDYAIPLSNVVRFNLRKRERPDFENPHELHFISRPWYSPYIALHLAAHMGAKRIGMIGVDFSDHHCYAATGPYKGIRHLPQVEDHCRRMNSALLEHGIKVFNLSARSRVTAFPRLSPADFERLPELSPEYDQRLPYRIVCYTAGPEETSAIHLARSICGATRHYAVAMCGAGTDRCQCDLNWAQSPQTAEWELRHADAVVLFDDNVGLAHQALLQRKLVIDGRHMPPAIPSWDSAHQVRDTRGPLTISYRSGREPRTDAVVIPILRDLAARFPIELDLSGERQGLLVIDEEFETGYGARSLEAVAHGAITINGIGAFPEQRQRFQEWAGTDQLPFVHADARNLEPVLSRLLRRGGESLAEEGVQNRRWLERYWQFPTHWERVWMPLLGAYARSPVIDQIHGGEQ